MTKNSFAKLLSLIENGQQKSMMGRPSVPLQTQLLLTLRYLATGSFQLTAADTIGVSQSTVCRSVAHVSRAIASLAPQFINMPDGEEARKIREGFYELVPNRHPGARPFPGIIGAIDGTHVPVLVPGAQNREIFRDRKGNISLNIQAICDHRLKFLDVVCRWPGSVHDSRMFNESSIMGKLERGEIKGWLLGDSGYPLKPYLLTPLLNPETRAEKNYNFSHIQARNVIERSFGVLKRRFAYLMGPVRQEFKNAIPSITSCFVLHNFLIDQGDVFDDPSEDGQDTTDDGPNNFDAKFLGNNVDGKNTRKNLIESHFI